MFLGGLWHGAAWSYAVWGSFHGVALAIERFLGDKISIRPTFIYKLFKGIMVFGFVTLAWLLFKLPVFDHVLEYFKCISNNIWKTDNAQIITYILVYSVPVIVYHFLYLLRNRPLFLRLKKFDYIVYGTLLFLIIVNSGSSGAFIYFQF
jgi:alginate O-acetyltransferase complex protein AlgI